MQCVICSNGGWWCSCFWVMQIALSKHSLLQINWSTQDAYWLVKFLHPTSTKGAQNDPKTWLPFNQHILFPLIVNGLCSLQYTAGDSAWLKGGEYTTYTRGLHCTGLCPTGTHQSPLTLQTIVHRRNNACTWMRYIRANIAVFIIFTRIKVFNFFVELCKASHHQLVLLQHFA